MAENNRNQSNRTDQPNREAEQQNISGQRGDSSQGREDNPQSGRQWSNYQTRELSSDQNSPSTEEGSDE